MMRRLILGIASRMYRRPEVAASDRAASTLLQLLALKMFRCNLQDSLRSKLLNSSDSQSNATSRVGGHLASGFFLRRRWMLPR
jgi:hypothetical protein